MADKKLDLDFNIADYETVQREIKRDREQKQRSKQKFRQMRKDVIRDAVDTFAGDDPKKRAIAAAATVGIGLAKKAAEEGIDEALKEAKKKGIDLGIKEFNKLLNESVNFFGIVTELKRSGEDIGPVFSYEREGEQGGFGLEYDTRSKTARGSVARKLGPGTVSAEAVAGPYGRSVLGRYTRPFNKGGKVYNKRGQPRKVKY
jgi:hypothetical protein